MCVVFGLFSPLLHAREFTIAVAGIEPQRGGYIDVLIFGESGFPKQAKQALQRQRVRASAESLVLHFDLQVAEFAVKVLHDADSNGQVSKNWTGIIPKEGLGFSNDQRLGLTGPPNYRQCKVALDMFASSMTVVLRYPNAKATKQ
jgi:uncharacterized protein (DUF2141 family)